MTARITLYNGGSNKVRVAPLINIKELITQFKFRPAGTCNCNGIFTEKYKNEKYLLKVRPRRNQHQLFYKDTNSGITNWITITELKAKLDELTQTDI